MKLKKHDDTTAQVKFALARGEIESNIPDFISAKFLGYENDREVHLVEGLNFCEPGEPNFLYEIKIDPATGKAYFGPISNLSIQSFLDASIIEIN